MFYILKLQDVIFWRFFLDLFVKVVQRSWIDPVVSKTSNGKTMILSKRAICDSKKSRFIKKQEASEILSS